MTSPLLSSQITQRLKSLCKPPGSLGVLESIASRLCEIQGTLRPVTRPRHVSIFAADHGVTCEGVSAWPSEVTASVTAIMGQAKTASGVFAKALDCNYEVVDVGLLRPCNPPVIDAARRRSTGNLLREPAMSLDDFDHAWQVGTDRANIACDAGNVVLVGGEMGIGNTTSASCLIALLCDAQSDQLVGRGAGVDDKGLGRKQDVVRRATDRVRRFGQVDAKRNACEVGGLEIVALAGFYVAGAARGCVLLVDGLIATSAALLADALQPKTRDCMIAGHRSTEPGHVTALAKLSLSPLLDLQMRLGEGTGALVALPLLDLAAAMINDMATLEELQ